MKANEAMRILNISRQTLCKYVKKEIIKTKLMPNGQYDYDEESIFKIINKDKKRMNVIYGRVSSSNQKKDLENQINTVTEFMLKNGIAIDKVYSDVSSGMNLDRKGFLELLEDVASFKVEKIFITYKDRMARLSFQMIENICNKYNTKIIILNEIDNTKTTEQEFLEEVVSLIHSFSMKMYSKRRKAKLELISKDLELEKNLDI